MNQIKSALLQCNIFTGLNVEGRFIAFDEGAFSRIILLQFNLLNACLHNCNINLARKKLYTISNKEEAFVANNSFSTVIDEFLSEEFERLGPTDNGPVEIV